MDIKLLGIEFEVGKGISIADLFSYIQRHQGKPVILYKYGRFLYIRDMGNFYAGLLITAKNQRKFIEFSQNAGVARLEARDVSQGAQLADFNYFLVSKKTGRGLYQYYHGSCTLDTFGTVCRRHYEELKKSRIDALVAGLPKQTTAKIKQCRDMFTGTLTWNVLVRPEAFRAMVEALKSVEILKVNVTTLALKKTIFSPVSNLAKRVTQQFRFPQNTSPTPGLVGELETLIENDQVQNARLEGRDHNGHHQVLKIENNPDSFGVYDYDEIAGKIDVNPDDFLESDFMKELLTVARQKKTLFD